MKQNSKKNNILAISFLLPAVVLVGVFIMYPLFSQIALSFQSWKGIYGVPKEFVGLTNYKKVLFTDNFWIALKNSMFFVVGTFVVLMPISFGLALLITSKLKFTGLMRTIYYIPVMIGTTTVALMWKTILNPNYGILASILENIGLGDKIMDWLNTYPTNVWITVLVNEWKYAGYNMLIFAAGISAVPANVYDAALIDGCTDWDKIRYVVLPLCKNSFKIFSILGITGCLKVFDIIWAMTGGGPNDASSTPAVLVYSYAFSYRKYGRSAAVAIILLIMGVVASIICNKVFKQEDLY